MTGTEVTITTGTPLDEQIHDYISMIDRENWASTTIRIPQPINSVIGELVDETHIGYYKLLSALVIHGHKRFMAKYENELLELKQLIRKASNDSKFSSTHFNKREQSQYYEFPMTTDSLSGPKSYYVEVKRKGRIEQQARWVGFENSMLVRHFICLSLIDSEIGMGSVWRDELLDVRDGFDEYLREWRVPLVIQFAE